MSDAIEESAMLRAAADAAQKAGDWERAHAQWVRFVALNPDHPAGLAGLGRGLVRLKRFDEAESLLADAVARFPEHRQILAMYARVAGKQERWAEALARWQAVRARFPDMQDAVLACVAALEKLDRLEEAEAVLAEAVAALPESRRILLDYARMAARRRDWAAAWARAEPLLARFPDDEALHVLASRALLRLQLHDRLASLLATALPRFPANAALAADQAKLALAIAEDQPPIADEPGAPAQLPADESVIADVPVAQSAPPPPPPAIGLLDRLWAGFTGQRHG